MINLKEIPYYKILTSDRRYWVYPLWVGAALGFLLLIQLFVFGDRRLTDPSDTPEDDAQQEAQGQTEMVTGYAEAKYKMQQPSFILETADGWRLLPRSKAFSNPKDWHVILVLNKGKVQPTLYAQEPQTWYPKLAASKQIIFQNYEKSQSTRQISYDRSRKRRFTLQLTSQSENQFINMAQLAMELSFQGYPAYITQAQRVDKDDEGNWVNVYQLKVGFFESEMEADDAAVKIKELYPKNPLLQDKPWPAYPNQVEFSGELVNFAEQRVKPLFIQLPPTDRVTAYRQLLAATGVVDHGFVSEQFDAAGTPSYRVRLGFFESQGEANAALAKMSKGGAPMDRAQILGTKFTVASAKGFKEDLTQLSR